MFPKNAKIFSHFFSGFFNLVHESNIKCSSTQKVGKEEIFCTKTINFRMSHISIYNSYKENYIGNLYYKWYVSNLSQNRFSGSVRWRHFLYQISWCAFKQKKFVYLICTIMYRDEKGRDEIIILVAVCKNCNDVSFVLKNFAFCNRE